jgi:hypothetical protein
VFLLSADGAATESGFVAEKAFLQNLIANVLPFDTTQVGLVEYATVVDTEVPLTLLNSTSELSIANTINNLTYFGGQTSITDAVNNALTIFNSDPDTSDPKLMILLQDHDPLPAVAQDPCDTSGLYPANTAARAGLAADSVTTLQIAGPLVNPSTLACLMITSESQFLPIGDLTVSDLEAEDSTIAATITTLAQSAVPEPAGWSLLALGFVVSIVLRCGCHRTTA